MSLTGPQPRDRERYELKAHGRKATARVELCGRKLDPASSFLALESLDFPQTSFSGLEEGYKSAVTGAMAERGGKRGNLKRKPMHCDTDVITCLQKTQNDVLH